MYSHQSVVSSFTLVTGDSWFETRSQVCSAVWYANYFWLN